MKAWLSLFCFFYFSQLFANNLPWQGAISHGSSKYSIFLFDIYTGTVWTENQKTDDLFKAKVAIELTYHRNFSGADIANKSAEEMKTQGLPITLVDNWVPQMQKAFPDVKTGDSLMAFFDPSFGITFYHNRLKKTHSVPNPNFAKSFLKIWLAPNSSNPHLFELIKG